MTCVSFKKQNVTICKSNRRQPGSLYCISFQWVWAKSDIFINTLTSELEYNCVLWLYLINKYNQIGHDVFTVAILYSSYMASATASCQKLNIFSNKLHT